MAISTSNSLIMNKNRKNIELFAGCGGMALGMESAGFELKFANEVSPMASNTFAYNVLGVDISIKNSNVKWIHSRYSDDEYDKRLRENLLDHKADENCEIENNPNLSSLENCLLVGDVRHLRNKLIQSSVSDPYKGSLDLISGGPPCQSFSLAGKRERNNYKNSLPLDFAEICEILNPKVVLMENVKGILSAFTENKTKHYAWFEVAKIFAIKGFAPICMLINSKYFGVAQNRPRYIMLALRKDVFDKLHKKYSGSEILDNISAFVSKIRKKEKIEISDLKYYDIEKNADLFNGEILPKPISYKKQDWNSVSDAIDDLIQNRNHEKSSYVETINSLFHTKFEVESIITNHNKRTHSNKIKDRFLFFQILNFVKNYKSEILKLRKNGELISSKSIKSIYNELLKFNIGVIEVFPTIDQFENFINSIDLTKKHSQRALIKENPSPAQLTIPDDICHYSIFENRVLTVREIARIQSFPDSFVFRSKETTGGNNRSYEVPQYTQVGNAVPPRMALQLGEHIINLLNAIKM
jgi:DNA (cytosine-5)-methyltransferase 1